MASRKGVESIFARDTAVRNAYAADAGHWRRVDFSPEVARGMVIGKELLKRVDDPTAIEVRTVEVSPTRHYFLVTEETRSERASRGSLNTPIARRLLKINQLQMADPDFGNAAQASLINTILGFNILAHWTFHCQQILIEGKEFGIFDPFLVMFDEDVRGGMVGIDSMKRLESGIRRLRFDMVLAQLSKRMMSISHRYGYTPLLDLDPRLSDQILSNYDIIFHPEASAVKPLNARLRRYGFRP